jgi:raffinose/stachyose/melibiose transport system permease protein
MESTYTDGLPLRSRQVTPELVRQKAARLALHVAIVAVALLWIYPFLWMVSASFKTQAEFIGGGLRLIPGEPTLESIVRAWSGANFSRYFVNTVIVTASTVTVVLASTSMMGYAVGKFSFPGKRVFLSVFIASMTIPLGYTIIPIFELIKALGLLNSYAGLILAESGGSHVFFILLFAGYFRQLPDELIEAARIDGATFSQTFVQVMLPNARPIVGSVVIMQFIWTWNSFFLPLVLTLSRPNLRTLAVGLYAFRGEIMIDWPAIAAGGSIATIPIIVLFLALQRYFVRGLSGAVKF